MRRAAVLVATLLAACGGRDAQRDAPRAAGESAAADERLPARFGLGRAATRAEIAALDTDVDTTGAGLPPGRGTAADGARIFAAKCAVCHGPKGEGLGPYPRLVQRVSATDSFPWAHGQPDVPKTVGNYWPHATTLYDYVAHAMPYPQPRSLTPDETYALVAWLLAENGVVPPGAVMDSAALVRVRLPMARRFVRAEAAGR